MNKFIIIFVILNIQFLIGSTFVLDQLKNLNYPEAISSEEWEKLNVSKINWLPVWQAEEQHSKPIIVLRDGINQQEVEEEARYASEQEMNSCEAPNGKGPQKILRDIIQLIPLEQIKQRFALYAKQDEQMQQLIALLRKPSFKSYVANLKKSDAFEKVRNYACSQLYLDIDFYSEILKKMHALYEAELNQSTAINADFKERFGIWGFLQDVHDLLPKEQIQIVMENAYETDPTISKVIERLQSLDLNLMLQKIKNSEEYRIVRRALKDLGIKDEVLEQIVEILLGIKGLN